MKMDELQLLSGSIADLQWFKQNSKEITEKFEGNFIAIKDKDIVDFAPDVNILLGKLKRKGVDESLVLIKRVIPQGEVVIF